MPGMGDALEAAEHHPIEAPRMRTTAARLIAFAALVFVAGCGESANVTSPSAAVAGPGAARSLLSSPATVQVVTRNAPLADELSNSTTVGIFGGSLSLPGTGLRIVVPPFAVTSPTRITVTAVAGSQVAYEFEPHGIHFLAPLVVTQDLAGTSAYNNGLLQRGIVAGYFANVTDLNPDAGTALVSELLSTSLSLLNHNATFAVFHFSGYLVATD
jgi:hypothetical protein